MLNEDGKRWITESGEEKELLNDNGFLYFLDSYEDDVVTAHIVDYTKDDFRQILLIPEKIGDYEVEPYYEDGVFEYPKNIRYIIVNGYADFKKKSFKNCADIKLVVAVMSDGWRDLMTEIDEPVSFGMKHNETCSFHLCKNVPVTDCLEPYYTCKDYMVAHETTMKVLKHLADEDDVEGMEFLLSQRMTIGDLYYNAIVGDDLETVIMLERQMCFPTYREIVGSKEIFFQSIQEDIKHFQSQKILNYYKPGK